jgi:hypothetical protein
MSPVTYAEDTMSAQQALMFVFAEEYVIAEEPEHDAASSADDVDWCAWWAEYAESIE